MKDWRGEERRGEGRREFWGEEGEVESRGEGKKEEGRILGVFGLPCALLLPVAYCQAFKKESKHPIRTPLCALTSPNRWASFTTKMS